MLITEVEEVEEEWISLDGSPPVPNKRDEYDEEEEGGEERGLEGEMVKELEVKWLEDGNVPVSRREEELVSSRRVEEGVGALLDDGWTLPISAPRREEEALLERKRAEVDEGMVFKVVKGATETGAAVWIDIMSSVDE